MDKPETFGYMFSIRESIKTSRQNFYIPKKSDLMTPRQSELLSIGNYIYRDDF